MAEASELPRGADRRIARFVDEHLDEIVRDLVAILRVPSVRSKAVPDAPFGLEVKRALDLFLARARQDGFAVDGLPGTAGHVEWGPADAPIVGILAHLDVVPAGAGWQHDPFGAEREGDRIYGRGAMDDKGPAVASYWALLAVRSLFDAPRRRVRLIVGGDEESGFECMHRYLAAFEMPALGFTPDAAWPIVTAEKGITTLLLSAAVGDGGDGRLVALSGGTRPNVVAAEAEARLDLPSALHARATAAMAAAPRPEGTRVETESAADGALLVRAHGRAAHASLPQAGHNAAAALLLALAAVDALAPSLRRALDHLGRSGMDLDGDALGVRCADDESGPLTANLGTISLVGGRIEAAYNLRYPVTVRLEELVAGARAAAAPAAVEVVSEGGHAPLRADPNWEIVRTLDRVFEAETGLRSHHVAIGGGTYARELPQGVAFGAQWAEDDERAHSAEEYLSVERLRRMVAIYARAIGVLSGAMPLP